MSSLKKSLCAAILGATIFGSAITSAQAFNLTDTAPSATSGAVVAYTSNAGDLSGTGAMMLTAQEVQHIRWCAAHYMSYNPTDNTVANRGGHRVACQSPD
jgi:hypothetical protein